MNKPTAMDKAENKELIRKLIRSIQVNNANLDYIAKTGIINGSLWLEIERILKQYAQQVSREDIKSFIKFTYDLNAETLAHVLYLFDKYFDEWIKNQ